MWSLRACGELSLPLRVRVSWDKPRGKGAGFTQFSHPTVTAIFFPLFSDIASHIAFNLLFIIKNCEKFRLMFENVGV